MSKDVWQEIATALAGHRPAGIGSKPALTGGLLSDDVRKTMAWATTRPLGMTAGFYPADAALDEEGNVICRSHYGRRDSQYGWEIDHRHPTALGGSNAFGNLRALHWHANCRHGGLLGNALNALR
jgi:hypothetical protein